MRTRRFKNLLVNPNRPFAARQSRGTKPPCWRTKVALGKDEQKRYIILNGNFLCLSCPGATFALQYGGFVPREWLAAKGLFAGNFSSWNPESWALESEIQFKESRIPLTI